MNFTEIRIIPVKGKSLKARAVISLENGCVLEYLKIIKKKTSYYVVIPPAKALAKICDKLGSLLDRATRRELRDAVLNEYIIKMANSTFEKDWRLT